MKLIDWLNKWQLNHISINAKFITGDFTFRNTDKDAAWELYAELITRVATQPLQEGNFDTNAAVESLYEIFGVTRSILKKYGRSCEQFSKVAIPVLNQVLRPFLSKWHPIYLQTASDDRDLQSIFCAELAEVQKKLQNYTSLLVDLAGIEALAHLEQ